MREKETRKVSLFANFPTVVQRHLWAGSAHITVACHMVDVLTESCQSSGKVFLLLLTQCIAAAGVVAAATTTALAHTGAG